MCTSNMLTERILQIILLVAAALFEQGQALHCLTCNDVIQPRHCHYVKECAQNELCFVDQFTNLNGDKAYNVGCRSSLTCSKYNDLNITAINELPGVLQGHMVSIDCHQCCNQDLCNFDGCSAPSLPLPRGPVCFSCSQSLHQKCPKISVCGTDEKCYLEKTTEFGDVFYSSSCKPKQECTSKHLIDPIFGRKRDLDLTRKPFCCCSSDLCNGQCDEGTNNGNGVVTASKEFLLMFLESSQYVQTNPSEHHITLLMTANTSNTNVSVESPAANLNTNYVIGQGLSNMTLDLSVLPNKLVVQNKGIYVRASHDISLYAFHQGRYQSEAFSVVPVGQLSTKYMVVSYTPSIGSVAGITALEDNTAVTISLNTTGRISVKGQSLGDGDSFTIDLSRLGSFELFHTSDLTGSIIESNKPVSVTSGNVCALNSDQSVCQRLTEQMLPINRWGKHFIVPSVPAANDGYYLRMIPTINNTGITVNTLGKGNSFYTANKEHFIQIGERNGLRSVSSNHPIFLSMVVKFSGGSLSRADPFMVNIPSTSEYGSRFQIAIPRFSEFRTHNLIILINALETKGLHLDGKLLIQTVYNVVPVFSTNYTQFTINVQPGMHTITHSNTNVRFGVLVFGYGYYTGYGYVAQRLQ